LFRRELLPFLLLVACGQATELPSQLRITETVPAGGSKAIPVSTTFVVVFSEKLDGASLVDDPVTLADAKGGMVPGAAVYDPDAASIAFDPDDLLLSDAGYTLSVSSSIRGQKSGGLGGAARFDYRTEWIDTGTPVDSGTDDTGTTVDDTAASVPFAPDHFAVYYVAGAYAGQPSEVWVDSTTTALPELVVSLVEGADVTRAKDASASCQLVFDLSSDVAVAVSGGTTAWSVAWGISLPRSYLSSRGRCDDLDPVLWGGDPVATLDWGTWTFGFEPLDPAMEPMLEARFGVEWEAVQPFLATTWIDTGAEPTVLTGFTWSYAIDAHRRVARDGKGAFVPQSVVGTTTLPNGWYPTDPFVAIPFVLPP
jgi:hypothetical protein